MALTCPWLNDHSDSSNTFVFYLLARKLFFFFFLRKNSHILLFLCLGETCSFILGKGSALKVTYVVKIKVSFCTLAARNLGALPLSAAGGEVAVQ